MFDGPLACALAGYLETQLVPAEVEQESGEIPVTLLVCSCAA
jgi:hypothetical protein